MEPSTTAFSELSSTELVRRLEAQNHELAVAHQKLEASRAEYAELYEQAPVGYVNLDPSGVIVDANAAAVAFFGHHRSLLIGAPFAAAARIKDKAAFRASMRHCAASREKAVSEVECITPDGGTLVLQLVSIADRVSCGDVTGFRLELTDLTAVGQVPAIALTAYARAEDVQHALAAGFTTHLPKPAGTEPLAALIGTLARRA